jgi:hypothetical protein
MTAQEKALQLFKSFGVAIAERVDVDGFVCDTEQAKQCALIAVDEILYAYPHTYDIEKDSTKSGEDITIIMNVRSNITYWNEVKQEILKL